jgi:DNA-dependent RNA polymerase auxiliary subunit epsilon
MKIFKVFFQKDFNQVPVREFTEAIYVEGESEADVRKKLVPRKYNIEFVTQISGAHLEYEQSKEAFTVESL